MTTKAHNAQQDRSLITFAVKATEFSRCKVYDFADGSFLVVHDNGRTEVNTISA